MNAKQIHELIIDVLSSVYFTVGDDGLASKFIICPVSSGRLSGGIYVTLFFRRKKLVPAAVKFRSLGPTHLRYLPLGYSLDLLRNFIQSRYHLVAVDSLLVQGETSLLERLSTSQVDLLVDEFAMSDVLSPRLQTCLLPQTTVQVNEPFEGSVFGFSTASGLSKQRSLAVLPPGHIDGRASPPFTHWEHKTGSPKSWLLVNAPSTEVASKYRASILGAVSLTISHQHRYQFTGREVIGGMGSVGDKLTWIYCAPHTPALGCDVVIDKGDHQWLEMLDRALASGEQEELKKLKSLQYFYRSWFLPENERFPIDCITIDSVFGDANGATEAVARGVEELFDGKLDRARVLLLMRLRNSVIHGGAPDVYDSSKYAKYYRDYGDDPIADMSALVAECLKRKIFDGKLREQPDPYEEIISQAVWAGMFPGIKPPGILAPLF